MRTLHYARLRSPRASLKAAYVLRQEAGPAAFEPYQGLLYMTEDYRVYGYISCTRVKFLVTVDDMVRIQSRVDALLARVETPEPNHRLRLLAAARFLRSTR